MLDDILYGVLDIVYDDSDGDNFQCSSFFFFPAASGSFFRLRLYLARLIILRLHLARKKGMHAAYNQCPRIALMPHARQQQHSKA